MDANNVQHYWMALMDGIHKLTALLDGINGRHKWTSLMTINDVINDNVKL
jgi:hypothetical protein